MVQTALLSLQVVSNVTKAFPSRQLSDQHCHKLAPAVIGSEFLTRMMNFSMVVEIMSRNKCSNLAEDCVIVCHGSDLLVLVNVFRKFIITQRDTRAFIYLVLFVNL